MKKIKSFFSKFKKNDLCKNIVLYTIIFAFLISYLCVIFIKYGKWGITSNDGAKSNAVNLIYLRELLVNFIRTGKISFFTWTVGNGFDIFSNYAYLILGDIFSYISVLVRTKDVDFLYNILIGIRFYFIGISYLIMAKYKKFNNLSSVVGSLIYTFSSYAIFASFSQTYYISSLILFPFLIIGIEKIIKENKTIFYTITIALLFLINFYFGYSISLILAIYGFALIIENYKSDGIKKVFKILFKVLCYSLLGIMIAGIILLPVAYTYLTSHRMSGNIIASYPIYYYKTLISNILMLRVNSFYVTLGTQSIVFIILPIFLIKLRKNNLPMFILFIVLLFPLLFSNIGSIFVGFNYPNNRWSFVFAFIFAYITSLFFNEDYNLKKGDIIYILIFISIFILGNLIFNLDISVYIEIQLGLFLIWLCIIYFKKQISSISKNINFYKVLIFVILTIGLATSIHFLFDINGNNYIEEFVDENTYKNEVNTSIYSIPDFSKAIKYIQNIDDGFYNIAKSPYDFENVSQILHFNSVGEYFPMVPKEYLDMSLDLENNDYYFIRGNKEFDYRTKILSLLGIKYLINYKTLNIPYGYTKMTDYKGKSAIYKNDYALPFGVLYTNYITEDEYENLSPLEKESSLLKTTVLENGQGYNHYSNDYNNTINSISYEIIDKNKVVNNNVITIKNYTNNTFDLKLNKNNITNSEIYVMFKNFKYKAFDVNELINLSINKNTTKYNKEMIKNRYNWYHVSNGHSIKVTYGKFSKTYSMFDIYDAYYINKNNFLFNLGYYDEVSGTITITLTGLGNYTFEDLQVYAVSMDDYAKDIENLRKSHFEVTDYGDGYLNGVANIEENGVLQFSTIYRKGWEIYIDGNKTEGLRSNKYFLGVKVTKGKHEITLKYHVPYVKEGCLLSLIGIIILIGCVIFSKIKKE